MLMIVERIRREQEANHCNLCYEYDDVMLAIRVSSLRNVFDYDYIKMVVILYMKTAGERSSCDPLLIPVFLFYFYSR